MLLTAAAARITFEATTARGAAAEQPWTLNRMQLYAWNGTKWTVWIRDGRFELVPEDTRSWSRHANDTLAFIDWDGELWQAKIESEAFVLAHRGNWDGETQRSRAIRYRDWSGRSQIRTVSQLAR